jgi:hypothetical protein
MTRVVVSKEEGKVIDPVRLLKQRRRSAGNASFNDINHLLSLNDSGEEESAKNKQESPRKTHS